MINIVLPPFILPRVAPVGRILFMYSRINNQSINQSVILKQLSDETMHNSNRYVDFIDGNGRGSLLQLGLK